MEIKNIIQAMVKFGIPINLIARRVNKDGSTIGKWIRGQTNISNELEQKLYNLVIEMNKEWQNIFLIYFPNSREEGGTYE